MRTLILSMMLCLGCVEILPPDALRLGSGAGAVCGNGRLELGEECDTDSSWCTNCEPTCRWPEVGAPGFYGDCALAAQCEHDLRREEVDRAYTACTFEEPEPVCLSGHAADLHWIGRILHNDLDWCRRRAND